MDPRAWSKVEELYHAALAKDAAEREAFLAQGCGGERVFVVYPGEGSYPLHERVCPTPR